MPYILHEAYDGRTFPRLQAKIDAYAGSATKPWMWVNGSVEKMHELGLWDENDLWSLASEREYSQWIKIFMECYRKDNLVSGYGASVWGRTFLFLEDAYWA